MRQPQLLRKVSGRRLQDAVTTGPEPALPPRPAPRPASCHHDSTPTPGQHPNTRTPRSPVHRHLSMPPTPSQHSNTQLVPRHSAGTPTACSRAPRHRAGIRQPTTQPTPRHPSAPTRNPAGSRLGSPSGVGDVPDEQGGVGGPGVARHAARGPAPSRPPRPLPGRPRSRRRGRGARGLSCRASIDLDTVSATREQT